MKKKFLCIQRTLRFVAARTASSLLFVVRSETYVFAVAGRIGVCMKTGDLDRAFSVQYDLRQRLDFGVASESSGEFSCFADP